MISTYTATLITNIETDLLFFRSGMETSVSESARTRKIFSPFWIGTTGWISYTWIEESCNNRLNIIHIKNSVRKFLSFGLVKQDGSNQLETPRQSPCFSGLMLFFWITSPRTSEEQTVVLFGGASTSYVFEHSSNTYLDGWVLDCFTKEHAPHPPRYLIAYKNLLRSIENIGIAVVYGIRLEQGFIEKISN